MIVTDNKLPRWVRYNGCHYYNPGHPICDGWISLWKICKDGHGCRAPVANVYPADPRQSKTLDEYFKPSNDDHPRHPAN